MAYWINEVLEHLKTQEICNEAAETNPWQVKYSSNHFKIQEKCNKAVRMDPWLLNYVPDWFAMQGQIKLWHDDDYHFNDNEIIEWYEGHQKRKVQKAKIKDELMPIAWHTSR